MKSKHSIFSCLTVLSVAATLPLTGCASKECHKKVEELPSAPSGTRTVERTSEGPLAQTITEAIQADVRITAIDKDTRKIVVRASDGELIELTVPTEIKRFDELRVGDTITTRFIRALAFEVREPTAEELSGASTAVAALKNPANLPPGVEVGALTRVVVTIQKIDLSNNTVTVKAKQGAPVTIKAQYPENLRRVKVGDTVVVVFGEAMAIELNPKN